MTAIANQWMFVDPEPNVRGILLSDRIEAYVKKFGLLVDAHDFREINLKPASYSLTLAAKYYLNGETNEIGSGGYLVIPPNSFVIAGIKEKLILPHWCAVRFGLRVAYVYRGLLMGAGPQVDPGFEGNLGCPLHNLTDRAARIKLDEPFAWIDFTKTSRLGDNPRLATESALLSAAAKRERDRREKRAWIVAGFEDYECRLYETQRLSFENSLPPGETISSSVKGLENSVTSIATEWKAREAELQVKIDRLTRVSQIITIASVVGLAAIFITVVLTIGVEIWMPRKADIIKLQQEVQALQRRVGDSSSASTPSPGVTPPPAPPPNQSPNQP
jgi:deoxycytidine triphosphate deaminase